MPALKMALRHHHVDASDCFAERYGSGRCGGHGNEVAEEGQAKKGADDIAGSRGQPAGHSESGRRAQCAERRRCGGDQLQIRLGAGGDIRIVEPRGLPSACHPDVVRSKGVEEDLEKIGHALGVVHAGGDGVVAEEPKQRRKDRRCSLAVPQRLHDCRAARGRHELGDAELHPDLEHHRIDHAEAAAGDAHRIEDAIVTHDQRLRTGQHGTKLGVGLGPREGIAFALDPHLLAAREHQVHGAHEVGKWRLLPVAAMRGCRDHATQRLAVRAAERRQREVARIECFAKRGDGDAASK